jgi:hypothetical protein
MSQKTRFAIALIVLLGIIGVVMGVDALQRRQASERNIQQAAESSATPMPVGSIPIYLDGQLVGGFTPQDLQNLESVSFIDAVEQKPQDGWLLRDVILLFIDSGKLKPSYKVVVSSSSRDKSIELTWAEVQEKTNMVMFDLSNRDTLKLVSLLEKLDTRDEWIQDVDKIEIFSSEGD